MPDANALPALTKKAVLIGVAEELEGWADKFECYADPENEEISYSDTEHDIYAVEARKLRNRISELYREAAHV